MKTPEQLKSMAEKAAEFLGLERNNLGTTGVWNVPNVLLLAVHDSFYNDSVVAPILMHHAKREMEKRGFWWRSEGKSGEYNGFFTKEISMKPSEWNKLVITDENEFISFWDALLTAIGGEGV